MVVVVVVVVVVVAVPGHTYTHTHMHCLTSSAHAHEHTHARTSCVRVYHCTPSTYYKHCNARGKFPDMIKYAHSAQSIYSHRARAHTQKHGFVQPRILYKGGILLYYNIVTICSTKRARIGNMIMTLI